MTQEQFKERTRQEIMKQRMIGYMVWRKVVVTDEEVAAYYEKHGRDFTAERTVDLASCWWFRIEKQRRACVNPLSVETCHLAMR